MVLKDQQSGFKNPISYRSFHEHERSFETWSSWFEEYLISRFATKVGNKIMAEGLVLYIKCKEIMKTTEGQSLNCEIGF